jgi:hypothetical protein
MMRLWQWPHLGTAESQATVAGEILGLSANQTEGGEK